MESILNTAAWLFFGSEVLLFLMKRSKSNETKIREGKSSVIILWLVITLSVFAAVYSSSNYPRSEQYLSLIWMGSLILLFGFIIRWTAVFQLKKAFTVDVAISHDHKLKKDGLYKKLRHPAYLGLLLEFLGLSFLFNSWLPLLLLNIPIFLGLVYRMSIEEEILKNNFGEEYKSYMKNTNKILPGIY